MRSLIAALCLSLLSTASLADQSATVFPPDDCARGTSGLISWRIGDSTTRCKSGQDVLKLALPNCAANQQVSFDGSAFVCEDKIDGPSPCEDGQVLTYTANGFICVAKNLNIPQCKADQFLTYNGTGFQCASTKAIEYPHCAAGQVVSSDGTKLTCVDPPTLPPTNGAPQLYQVSCAGDNYRWGCLKINTQTGETCRNFPNGNIYDCLPPPSKKPPQPIGTYSVSCAFYGSSSQLCAIINTQTGKVCVDNGCIP
ncbi:hypothetical protein [Rhodopseudomonas sp.]|uniref:hypothetical protein n=1 Tax=Rhodopseudomonas sp. TaxID=1078 RepID=UPI0039E364C1